MPIRDISDRTEATGRSEQGDPMHIITMLSERLLCPRSDEIDTVIDDALSTIANFRGADRCYLFQFDRDMECMTNTHEWCAPGIPSQMERLKALSTDQFPWWMATLRAHMPVIIPDVQELPDEASSEREILEAQDIRSLMAYPVLDGGRLAGFLGIDFVSDRVTFDPDDHDLFNTVVRLFSTGIRHKRDVESIRTRDAIMDVLNRTTTRFLKDGPSEKGMEGLIRGLGQAADVDSVYVYRLDAEMAELLYEWNAQGIPMVRDAFRNIDLRMTSMGRYIEQWKMGKAVLSKASMMEDEVRSRMMQAGLRSVIAVPIIVDDDLWGLMGLHDHRRERDWADPLVEALRAASGIIGMAMQISKARVALEESRGRMELAVKGAGIGVWEWDLLTDAQVFSEEWLEMFGYSEEDAERLNWKDLTHPADLERVRVSIGEYLTRPDGPFKTEFRMRCKNGDWKWGMSLGMATRDDDGRPTKMIGVHIDLSERRFLQDSLRMALERLDLLNRVLRHDMVNQVTAIKGYAELIMEDDDLDGRTRRYIGRIMEASSAIMEQIRFADEFQMMGLEEPQWQDIGVLAEQTFSEIRSEGVRLDMDIGGLEIISDEMFANALRNMFGNSLKHGGGVKVISIDFDPSRGELIIADDGQGIPAYLKELVFENGFGNDHGYGLFLVREILKRTAIGIREEGESGKGTRFVLSIPKGHWRISGASGSVV